jgi:metal-dependent hydrolase (beta-lactamase superfamily II)
MMPELQQLRKRVESLAAHQNSRVFCPAGKLPHVRRTAPGKFAVPANTALLVDGYDGVVSGGCAHGSVSNLTKEYFSQISPAEIMRL